MDGDAIGGIQPLQAPVQRPHLDIRQVAIVPKLIEGDNRHDGVYAHLHRVHQLNTIQTEAVNAIEAIQAILALQVLRLHQQSCGAGDYNQYLSQNCIANLISAVC